MSLVLSNLSLKSVSFPPPLIQSPVIGINKLNLAPLYSRGDEMVFSSISPHLLHESNNNLTEESTGPIQSYQWDEIVKTAFKIRGGSGPISFQTSSSTLKSSTDIPKPQARAVLQMAIAMSLHYLAYSLARPTTLALFTSAETGFAGNHGAFPLAMACISPASLLLLLVYGKILNSSGPRVALRQTTCLCSLGLGVSSAVIYGLKRHLTSMSPAGDGFYKISWILKSIVGVLFIFRESYVQLLTSQYWSFMASVITPQQSSKWFAPITGLTSITSAIAGMGVSVLVDKVGLTGALCVASTALMTSLIFSERAYSISDEFGFNPAHEHHKSSTNTVKSFSKNEKCTERETKNGGTIQKAAELFRRVPVLKGLFLEILAGQGLSTLLNVCFVTKLSQTLPDDGKRAGWMGKFFATINMASSLLQFAVMPQILPRMEPRNLWRFMPLCMVIAVAFQSTHVDPSIYVIGGAFMLMKIMEFSIRRLLDEMVYVPLDFESRFVGKEIISVFGYRFGKSGMSLALSVLTSMFGNLGIQQLSFLTFGSALIWLSTAWNVSNLVSTRAQAEETYKRNKSA
jgi:ATP/ADP translocase